MHRARITLFGRGRSCFMTRVGLGCRGLLRGVGHAALLRHKRRQRCALAEKPGECHRANATPDCGHECAEERNHAKRANQGYDGR